MNGIDRKEVMAKVDKFLENITLEELNEILKKCGHQEDHPVEQIVPKEAGELWAHPNGNYFMTYHIENSLCCRNKFGIESWITDETNLDKWTRLFPEPIKEEVVIEGVQWRSDVEVVYTYTNEQVFDWDSLIDKPPMTMKLTWPKK